ncbi:hypothetical protein Bint_0355 [Brachyspira intermedia PWS/A]|uniref:Thymidylate kinase-like domain-containing protein n=1 Tax=Brachyspira intermedia (strain ATCC 51140 / PWS/A) TaxID=1045858 RepID=G0EII1_BRAIP|nr:dTMP kinase [Brachyspira intermedia]AEM20989.1 hypothetical protein Bint_0355 [Brachyspira intermedia PWS/A]
MNVFDELYKVFNSIIDNNNIKSPIPIFSFEGLPGVGKTTQIKKVSKYLSEKVGKVHYIDLPTSSPIGSILKSLYSDEKKWNEIRIKNPWLNPVMLSTDLIISINNAVENGAKYAVMSRGILSTYYYNIDAYGEEDINIIWSKMQYHMKAFYKPTAIIFMNLPEEEAHKRILKRNRGPLREMDKIEKMKKDRLVFDDFIKRLENIPIHYIDALGSEEEVTDKIIKELKIYL